MPSLAKFLPEFLLKFLLRFLLKFRALVLSALFLVTMLTGPAAVAQVSDADRAAFREAFSDVIRDPALFADMANAIGLDARKAPLFQRYIDEVMTDPVFLDRFTEEIVTSGLFDAVAGPDGDLQTGFSLGYEIVVSITTSGLSKMDHGDIRTFFRLMSELFTLVEPRSCRVLMQQQGATQAAQLETSFAVMRGMSFEQFRTYLSLSRTAIESELSGAVPRGVPNSAQMDLANQAFVMKFEAALMEMANPRGVIASLSAPHTASDMDFCDAGKMMFTVLADMDGLPGRWMRLATLAAAS